MVEEDVAAAEHAATSALPQPLLRTALLGARDQIRRAQQNDGHGAGRGVRPEYVQV